MGQHALLPTSPRLSQSAYEVLNLNPEGYQSILARKPTDYSIHARLAATDPAQLITGDIKNIEMAKAVSCGLWLWHDWLEEAHRIAQSLHNETGSFWHAIMHRREGDFSNAKYWYDRCRSHPALMAINNQSSLVLADLPADNRLIRLTFNGWNCDYLVDLVEAEQKRPDEKFSPVLLVLQQLEWRVLIEYCASLA